MQQNFATIEQALDELRAGRLIMAIDDPDRENEGDLICAAEFATTENVNFMATHAKGLICTPMSAEIAARLGFEQMVKVNTDNHHTAFTVSVDHVDTSTGISAEERGLTCRACADTAAGPADFRRPGHVFPLTARRGGVLTRNGHTEATVDLCRIAGLQECGLCCEIMRDDGTMMRTTELLEKAREWGVAVIAIRDLQDYCRRHDKHVVREASAKLPTRFGEFQIYGYVNDLTGEHHVALVKGKIGDGKN
ncbi:MAG: 3,4-dihydroxy-2-butanone-4-phosphate synthase, partial [Clostridiaceae bacterium]|nr:3,4-dihydroxy-2-butanone-4-phosphate synthase [Clostridiaceae bacterium]